MEHKICIMLLFIAGAMMTDRSTGQSSPPPPSADPTCLAELLLCQGTNTSTPSFTCCTALKTVYSMQKDCLCLVVASQNLTNQLGLNSTQISDLLVECQVTKDSTTFCNGTSPIAAPPLPFTPGGPNLPIFPPPGSLPLSPPPPSKAPVLYEAMWIRLSGFASLFLFSFVIWY